jgi:hypothetical protein
MRVLELVPALVVVAGLARAELWIGLEEAGLSLRSTNLEGFPAVTWTPHPGFEVNGMATAPDGWLYVCNGPFTTRIHAYDPVSGATAELCTASVDLHGLGYGNGTLYGFANFASPMGIYSVNVETGAATLAVSTAPSGRRFFGLDFNPADGLLYGYDEYGSPSGLCSIDPESGAITHIAGSIPAPNGQGRALAVGNGVVYLGATRGDEEIACYAWDLEAGGPWTAFTQAYPAHHNTGGMAFLGGEDPPQCSVEPSSIQLGTRLMQGLSEQVSASFTVTNTGGGVLSGFATAQCPDAVILNPDYSLEEGESQQITVHFTAEGPGNHLCVVDPGGGCDPLPIRVDLVLASIFHGDDSACGLVEVLGHLPGPFSGYMVDWNAGDVGVQLQNGAGHPLSAGIWMNGEQVWSGPINTERWEVVETGFHPSALGEDITLFLTVSDGEIVWNEGGALCAWDLRFAGVDDESRPDGFRLEEPAPNPFNPSTDLALVLAAPAPARLAVYDVAGRLVATLHEGPLPAGRHVFRWEPGSRAGGLYLVRAQVAEGTQTRRVVYLP